MVIREKFLDITCAKATCMRQHVCRLKRTIHEAICSQKHVAHDIYNSSCIMPVAYDINLNSKLVIKAGGIH